MFKSAPMKASKIVGILEDLAIEEYNLSSDNLSVDPRFIEIKNPQDYSSLLKTLNLKSSNEYIGSPCFNNKLQIVNYHGWTFETIVKDKDSHLLKKLEKEKLLL